MAIDYIGSGNLNENEGVYENVLANLRALCQRLIHRDNQYGGIIFFEKKVSDGTLDQLCLRTFPISTKSTEFIPEAYRAQILATIGKQRPYDKFFHKNNFLQKYQSVDHFMYQLETEYSQDHAKYQDSDWEEILRNIENKEADPTKLDQLLLPPDCKNLRLIPLPVLSTPSVLLVVNTKAGHIRPAVIQKILFQAKGIIHNYLYNRLITVLNEHVKLENYDTEADLVRSFVEELNNVFLPISYQINKEEKRFFYRGWPDSDSTFTLQLNDFNIHFELTSFYFPFENADKMLHEHAPYFQPVLHELKNTVENIYKLIYNYWSTIQSVEDRAKEELMKQILDSSFNESHITSTVNMLNSIKSEVAFLKQRKIERLDHTVQDRIYIREGQLIIVDAGIEILSIDLNKKADCGFQDLSYILRNPELPIEFGKLPSYREEIEYQEDTKRKKGDLDPGVDRFDRTKIQDASINVLGNNYEIKKEKLMDILMDVSVHYSKLWDNLKDFSEENIELHLKRLDEDEQHIQTLAELVAKIKKPVDNILNYINRYVPAAVRTNFFNSFKKIGLNVELSQLKRDIDKLHNSATDRFGNNYSKPYDKMKIDSVREINRNFKQKSPQSLAKDKMMRRINSALKRICDKSERFKLHFESSGLYTANGKSDKLKFSAQSVYSTSKLSESEKIDWKFE